MAATETGTINLVCSCSPSYNLWVGTKRVGSVDLNSSLDEQGRPTVIYVSNFIILPPYRGQGLAKQMLGEIARIAESKQCNKLRLMVLEDNLLAIKIYEKDGFEFVRMKNKYRIYEKGI